CQQKDRLLVLNAAFDFTQAEFQGVIKSSPAAHCNVLQSTREFVAIVGEILQQVRAIRKRHKKNVVVFVNGPDKALYCSRGGSDLPLHAPAGIQHNAQADRQVVGLAEVADGLNLAVLFDDKVILCQVRNIVSGLVCNSGNDIDECDINFQLCSDDRCGQE